MNIVFDFDGTIAKSTPYHKVGWQGVLRELDISQGMDVLLPYEPGLKERFDSYRRLKAGFFKFPLVKQKLFSYFNSQDENEIVNRIMDLKESLTIKTILDENMHNAMANLAPNIFPAISIIKNKKWKIGIISSTRATIISAFLLQCGILDSFDFIIGEESLVDDNGILNDKPNPYALKVALSMDFGIDVYIGDNELIDKEFADNCHAPFIFADNQTNFLELINKINL